jgi:hypothetical protein
VKTVAILQSNYIPWKGYFDLIASADEFVLLDDVQFTKNDWRNRNRRKAPGGPRWLSIPVRHERLEQSIAETRVADRRWAVKHWKTLAQCYARARCFDAVAPYLEDLYRRAAELELLSAINQLFIKAVCARLGITTRIRLAGEFTTSNDRIGRLLEICTQTGATEYLSGPAAQDYLDPAAFAAAGIAVRWMQYDGYPEYEQPHPPFSHQVSIVDLLLCTGPASRDHLQRGVPAPGPAGTATESRSA